MIQIQQERDSARKRTIAEVVLSDLPEWFGIPESTQQYVEHSGALPFWSAYLTGSTEPAGFVAVRKHFPHAYEIEVMGVKRQYHQQGVGRQLILAVLQELSTGDYLQVKTLSEKHPDLFYKRTRQFYQAMGFLPLEETLLWGEENPCLTMIMTV